MADLKTFSDVALWQHAVETRCEDAFRTLVARHRDPVWGLCSRMLRNSSDAEDAFQMTFLALLERGAAIKKPDFGAWLHRVAYRASLRVQSNRVARATDTEVNAVPEASMTADVFREIEQAERVQLIEGALDSLPLKYREVVVLHYWHGIARGEIAARLGLTPQAVKARLQRGRAALRPRLNRRGLSIGVAALSLRSESTAATIPPDLETATWQLARQSLSGDPVDLDMAQFSDFPRTEHGMRPFNGMNANLSLAALATVIALFLAFEAGRAQGTSGNAGTATAGAPQLLTDAPPAATADFEPLLESNVVLASHLASREQLAVADPTAADDPPFAQLPAQDPPSANTTAAHEIAANATQPPAQPTMMQRQGLPEGTWTRDSVIGDTSFYVHGRQVQIDFAGKGEAAALRCSLRGEYSVASDGTIYGLVHSVDLDPTLLAEDFEEMAVLSMISDLPFTMRVHSDGEVMAVKSMTVGVPMIGGDDDTAAMGPMAAMYLRGTYHSSEAKHSRRPLR